MVRTRSFSTKNGYCNLFPDRIELENRGPGGRFQKWLGKLGWRSVGLLYLLLAMAFLLAGLLATYIDNLFLAAFFAAFGLVSLYASWIRRKFAFTHKIPRNQIEAVRYFEAVKGVSRARFEVDFRPKKRLYVREILMPSLLQNGQTEAQSAYWMMREEGFLQESS